MCGIFGFYSINGGCAVSQRVLEKLSLASSSRGKEASGMAALSAEGIVGLIRSDLIGRRFLKSPEYQRFALKELTGNEQAIIGHTRLATHGTQLDLNNNQPVMSTSGRSLLTHNGIITNDRAMWEQIRPGTKQPLLDSAILTELLEKEVLAHGMADGLTKTFSKINGSASVAFLMPEEKSLALATNTGSLHYAVSPHKAGLYFASEKLFLESVSELKDWKKYHLRPMTALVLSLEGAREVDMRIAIDSRPKGNKNSPADTSNTTSRIIDHSISKNKSAAKEHYVFENDPEKIWKHDFDYAAIASMQRCSRCILPYSTPFIDFDSYGVCNYCREHRPILHLGLQDLEAVLSKYRKGDGSPDCIAAFSGGRDSSYGLHFLKKELGLQPLAYTYDWGMITDLGRRNQARMLGQLGVEHVVVSADITMKRKHIRENILAWMKNPHLGMVPLFMEGDKQCEFHADRLMRNYGLKLMFFFRGNELEKDEFKAGHAGVKDADPGGVIHNLEPLKKLRLLSFYAGQYLKNPAYFNSSFFDTGLAFFSTYIQRHDYRFLWHYVPWDEDRILNTLVNEYDWEVPTETPATWRTDDGSSAFYNYIYYQVQGFTENDSFRSRQVREGILTREKALELVNAENRPRHEALRWYFDMLGLDGDEVLTVVDRMPRLY
jgi:glutamine---fructose-6-phosphate transaminase (isomerizing)